MPKITTENHVKALVKKWFDNYGAWSYSPLQNGLGVHGIPDRLGCLPVIITKAMVGMQVGLFVAIECKKPGRRKEAREGLSAHQEMVLKDIAATGGIAQKVDGPDDLMAIDGVLEYITEGVVHGPR